MVPRRHDGLVWFVEDDGVESVGVGVLKEGVGKEGVKDFVEFGEGKRVEGVVGNVGGVVAGGGFGWFFDGGGEEAVV